MEALRWPGTKDIRIDDRDVILEATATAICGSDLQLYHGYIISHRLPLDSAASAYEIFSRKEDRCTEVVLTPGMKPAQDDEGLAVAAVPEAASRPGASVGRTFADVLKRLAKQSLLPAPC